MEPTHTVSPSALRHTGRGVPQKRLREMAQSRAPTSQLPKRPSRRCSGTHAVVALAAITFSRMASTRTNQLFTARKISGVSER